MSWSRAVLVLPLLLAACGFHVRGVTNFPPEISVIYIETPDRHSDFYKALVTEIRGSELTLTDDPTSADTVIRILNDVTGRRTLSVSARNVPTEYEVYYTIHYAVSIDGKEVMPPKTHVLTRQYTYDETLVLGKQREEEVLRKAVAEDLVGMVVQNIGAIAAN
jgi:LPS-assembly lipoprotein